jgi:GNAT superfamily N-acetyltransferase
MTIRFRIKLVDTLDDEIIDTIRELNNTQEQWPKLLDSELTGHFCAWWLAYRGRSKEVAGFAGINPSVHTPSAAYFKRVLVVPEYYGHGLQLRFMRTLEKHCRSVGWAQIVSETTDTVYSANNFVRAGYEMYEPKTKWAFENSIYWRKKL